MTLPLRSVVTLYWYYLVWIAWTDRNCFAVVAGLPVPAQYFKQRIDHLPAHDAAARSTENEIVANNNHIHHSNSTTTKAEYYIQRYYTYGEAFAGPGHPIFLILGGEGEIPPSRGVMYEIVVQTWAHHLGAFVLQPEHRFYGESQPITTEQIQEARDQGCPDPRIRLLTTEQALYDAVALTRSIQRQLQCNMDDRTSPHYCPVIAVGGSYPGFMALTARLRFPHVVDIGYAASAPVNFYAQTVPQVAYFRHVSQVADLAVPGCKTAVRSILTHVQTNNRLLKPTDYGFCPATVPAYAAEDGQILTQEVVMILAILFANSNMGYYPPSPDKSLVQVCHRFMHNQNDEPLEIVKDVLLTFLAPRNSTCLDFRSQLPSGPHATVSGGDWSGVGSGPSGESWDFQTCSLLVEAIGFDVQHSMFPNRPWSLTWLTDHCQRRFGVTPQPHKLVQSWRFDPTGLIAQNASYILFTNGLLDGWSVSGVQTNLTDSVVAVNFPNGAHHSDLSGPVDPNKNTKDIRQGRQAILQLLENWLQDIRTSSHPVLPALRGGKAAFTV